MVIDTHQQRVPRGHLSLDHVNHRSYANQNAHEPWQAMIGTQQQEEYHMAAHYWPHHSAKIIKSRLHI
jgi:hypothetical protein